MKRNPALPLFFLVSCGALALTIFPPKVLPPPVTSASITDMQGSPVQVTVPAQRVMIFPVVLSSYLTINNGPSHLLAASKSNVEQIRSNILGRLFPAAAATPLIQNAFLVPRASDVEEVMRQKPDVVISYWYPTFVDPLKVVGMPGIIGIAWRRPDGQGEEHRDIWTLLGAITGNDSRTQSLFNRYARKRRQVLAEVPHNAAAPPSTAVLDGQDGFAVLGWKSMWLTDKLDAVGVKNIALEQGLEHSHDPEDLIRLNPEIILLEVDVSQNGQLEALYAKPELQTVAAIRNRRVYIVPAYSFADKFLEEPLLLEWLAELFYPNAMPHRLRADYQEMCQEVFGHQVGDDDIDHAIYLKENLRSVGYNRFARQER